MSKVKIIVATHKQFEVPSSDIYFPIHVGAINKKDMGYLRDDTGLNISYLNPYFSELTGLFWAWKNLKYDYLGLDHYRRLFSKKNKKYKSGVDINTLILDEKDVELHLKKCGILVPTKRNYYIETLYSHYANTFDSKHLDLTRDIIKTYYSEYLFAFDKVMKQRSGYMFNMFIMEKHYIDEYCEWLFDILFKLQEKVDISDLSEFEARLFGRVSELLFNVWLEKHQYDVLEIPYINAFNVNWWTKGMAFLKAKFFKKKYTKSF